ncbi:serine hydrolase domain-containing protein [Streptomyces sp. MJM8645]|uniref:serine hydrolase domain-containing protein n=1 Tax=Streptomyces sp. MJM8645 TaxID=1120523 RepID=UPI0007AEFF39|nr:serine hydrolase domain-containing protein [Streptomyces sp. MJM8645]
MTTIRRPHPAASRSTRRAACAALVLTGLLATAACSGGSPPNRPAGGAALTAEPAALSPSASGSGAAGGSAGAVVPLTPDVANQLDAAIKQVLGQTATPGVIVGITTPDGSYQRAFGQADKSGTPMSPDLNMRIGSVTKTFTATGVLRLVDQGKVGLDDPVSKYVDGVPGGDTITIRQLAGMRSGLFPYTSDPDFVNALISDPNRVFTPDQLLAYGYKHPANFPPGSKFQYSNSNYILLGKVIEKAGGEPVDQFLKDQVFSQAGLNGTVFPTDATFPDPHARGYTDQTPNGQTTDATDWNPSWAWSAGAVISNLTDLQNWTKSLATGSLLKQDTQSQRLKTQPTGDPGVGYGLGLFNNNGWIGHNGSLPGYETVAVYLPQSQATLVVLLNTDVPYRGSEPSSLFAKAITQIVSPKNVYSIPPMNTASPSASSSGSASPSPSLSPSGSGSASSPASPGAPGSPSGAPTTVNA